MRYDSYKVIFSPLVSVSHSAHRGEKPNYRESLMFVGAPHVFGQGDLAQAEVARMIFTEVDHNFVNPVSDRYKHEIDQAIANLPFWKDVDVSGGYKKPYDTFNEYMTWSAFTLWARDTYPRDVFKYVYRVNRYDMTERGFPRFADFDDALLDAVPRHGTATPLTAYPHVISAIRDFQTKATPPPMPMPAPTPASAPAH